MTDAELVKRCELLASSVTRSLVTYIVQGLLEKDKMSVLSLLTTRIMRDENRCDPKIVKCLYQPLVPLETIAVHAEVQAWASDAAWNSVHAVSEILGEEISAFDNLCDRIAGDPEEWAEWIKEPMPETLPMPGDLKNDITKMEEKLILLRLLRPDRFTMGMILLVKEVLGNDLVEQPPFDMEAVYQETSASTPVLFMLFPGVDPTVWVEKLGAKLGMTADKGFYTNISMGQGQEHHAENIMRKMAQDGGWVFLQNVHLMQTWLPTLNRTLEIVVENCNPNFRCFLSAEPPPLPTIQHMPESLLQASIKIANEAPVDLKSNVKRAWRLFSNDFVESCAKPTELRAALFGLCLFHAVLLGRKRFGAQGWSRAYGFNDGDLTICADVVKIRLNKIGPDGAFPWEESRYILGDIMYGGHITDFWDRRTNSTYLEEIFNEGLLTSGEVIPGMRAPQIDELGQDEYIGFFDRALPADTPNVYGLHPNAEIDFLVHATEATIEAMETVNAEASAETPKARSVSTDEDAAGPGAGEATSVRDMVQDIYNRTPRAPDVEHLRQKAKGEVDDPNKGPFVVLALQEAERMSRLLRVMKSSLSTLKKGLDGQLNMSPAMDELSQALALNQVPGRNPLHTSGWERYAWPSRKSLQGWLKDLKQRVEQIQAWTHTFKLPTSLWISGLFNPTSFLTAIKQVSARKNARALDRLCIETHVTTYMSTDDVPDSFTGGADGVLVHGLFLEGAAWLVNEESEGYETYDCDGVPCGGSICDAKYKETMFPMPVVLCRAVAIEESFLITSAGVLRNDASTYNAPVYATRSRGAAYVTSATLKTIEKPARWVLAGAAIIMSTDGMD
eukprot:CAMPEP_0118852082 /NCGR_PEP_ID=MMETSP1163-20130328/1251_1 /TAXON_ID=124430 /ORGANISM="Phaeomonas parva, Strain CCMP2877" /LENGTH=843 /DNA_ID=CAMNT_0006784483 /DNA_START=11 /DNA_END=2542 /DNA_ORIENTATION=+